MKQDITSILKNIHDKEPEKVVCNACNGSGKSWFTINTGRGGHQHMACQICQGTGTIKAPTLSHDIIDKEKKATPIDVREEEEREG